MKTPFSRRDFLRKSALATGAGLSTRFWPLQAFAADNAVTASPSDYPIAPGPFQATRASLQNYRYPGWYRDAKFGIWAHWGPQSQPEMGDW